MATYYLDTSIWLDFYEKREQNGELAFKLLLKIIEEDSIIIYSDLHINELKNLGYDFDEINGIFSVAKPDHIRRAHIFTEQKEFVNKIAHERGVPKGDVLHAILARDSGAQLVTRDEHFQKLKDITIPKKPEELIS